MSFLSITFIVFLFMSLSLGQSTIINLSVSSSSLTAEFTKNTNGYQFTNIQQSSTIDYSNEKNAPYMVPKSQMLVIKNISLPKVTIQTLSCILPVAFVFTSAPSQLNGFSFESQDQVVLGQNNFDAIIKTQKIVYNSQVNPLFQTQVIDLTKLKNIEGSFNLGLVCLFDLQQSINTVFQIKFDTFIEYFNQSHFLLNMSFFNLNVQKNNVFYKQFQIPLKSQIQIGLRNITQDLKLILPKFQPIQIHATLYESADGSYKITQIEDPYNFTQSQVASGSVLVLIIQNPTSQKFFQDIQIKQINRVYEKKQLVAFWICFSVLVLILTYNFDFGFIHIYSHMKNSYNNQQGGISGQVYPIIKKEDKEAINNNSEMKKLN